MAVINLFDRRSGITYVYESLSYWDKEKQQPRAKHKLIGKRDPQTGEIVPPVCRSTGRLRVGEVLSKQKQVYEALGINPPA